ncbi:MAG TPA: YIP1 family protein [Methanosarcinales archaeon]|nr:MAG: YIP1 family protein [Methanosarcinales archaeon]HDN65876.1 YIP1 family protein [Methanosarcinales archaeon]
MTNVLTNPDRFFAELSAKDTKLLTPFAIVLVTAIIAAISAAMAASAITSTLPEEAAAFAGIGAAIGAIGGLIVQFIMWFLYAGVFYVISMFFSGEGSFKRCLEFIGYGFIPLILGAIIGLVVLVTVLPTIEFSVENPELFQQTLLNNPTMQASAVIGTFLTLWSANIWIFAVKHARNISTKNALITVGVPVGLYLLYSISMWL